MNPFAASPLRQAQGERMRGPSTQAQGPSTGSERADTSDQVGRGDWGGSAEAGVLGRMVPGLAEVFAGQPVEVLGFCDALAFGDVRAVGARGA